MDDKLYQKLLECSANADKIKEWNQWHRGNPEMPLDLQNADLAGSTFWIWKGSGHTVIDLSGADLRNANLNYIDFTEVNLTNVNLHVATICNVDLKEANLTNASAVGAFFDQSLLVNTLFAKTNLQRASFQGARMTIAHLSSADLTDAKVTAEQLEDANTYNITGEPEIVPGQPSKTESLDSIEITGELKIIDARKEWQKLLSQVTFRPLRKAYAFYKLTSHCMPVSREHQKALTALSVAVQFFHYYVTDSRTDDTCCKQFDDMLELGLAKLPMTSEGYNNRGFTPGPVFRVFDDVSRSEEQLVAAYFRILQWRILQC